MKRIFRKNQIVITALALLIAVAGYISYTQANTETKETASIEEQENTKEASMDSLLDLSEEDLANSVFTDTEDSEEAEVSATEQTSQEVASAEDGTSEEDISDAGATVFTSAETNDIASQMKLNREQTRSKNKETLMEIINNENLSDDQKESAVEQLVEMTEIAEKESAAENLLAAKGFSNVVVSIGDDSVDVVLDMGDATEAKRAQVEDIVKRKTGISAENIVITPISS